MKIKIFITGGTIDCNKIKKCNQYVFEKSYIPQMLKQGRVTISVDNKVLMMKDSLYMNDADREIILKNCKEAKEKNIIITHGTDTMTKTAAILGKNIKNKTVVLIGAIVPYNKEKSDALFNFGFALSAAQILPRGVYVAMNGKVFKWNNVRKNKRLKIFEKLK